MNWKSKNQKQVRKCFPKAVLYILPSRKMENSIIPLAYVSWDFPGKLLCFFSLRIFECLCFSTAVQLTSLKAKRTAHHLEKENHCRKYKINSDKPFEVLVLISHQGLKKKCFVLWSKEVALGTTVSTSDLPGKGRWTQETPRWKCLTISACLQGWAYESFFFPFLKTLNVDLS